VRMAAGASESHFLVRSPRFSSGPCWLLNEFLGKGRERNGAGDRVMALLKVLVLGCSVGLLG
jgi:hypothetical protein